MAMQELTQNEIQNVSGALSLSFGTSAIVFDTTAFLDNTQTGLNGLIDGALQPLVNNVIDGVQALLGKVLGAVPAVPTITVPVLGFTIGFTVG